MKKRIPDKDEVWVKKRFSFARHGEEEKWLEEMAGKGLLLVWAGTGGYRFKKAQPLPVQYMVDFMSEDEDGYATDFERKHQEEGWKPVCKLWGRYYFKRTDGIYVERHHFDITKFIRDEKWPEIRKIIWEKGWLVLLIGGNLYFLLKSVRDFWGSIPSITFTALCLILLIFAFASSAVRRIIYLLGLEKMLKRGGVV